MKRPTVTSLKDRARQMLEDMTARATWMYAVPPELDPGVVLKLLMSKGFVANGDRHEGPEGASIELEPRPDLEVCLVRASGEAAAPVLAEILELTGFYAQSALLETAWDPSEPEAGVALATLVEMAVTLDPDWRDLVAAHLSSPLDEVRRSAFDSAVVLAERTASAAQIAAMLEAHRQVERDPELRAALQSHILALTPAQSET